LRQNKESQALKHSEKLKELEVERIALEAMKKELSIKERELNKKEDTISVEVTEKDEVLNKIWIKENKDRTNKRTKYLDEIIDKKKKKAKNRMVITIIVTIILIAVLFFLYYFVFTPVIKEWLDKVFENKVTLISIASTIGAGVINYFSISNCYNWSHNPSFEATARAHEPIPEYLKNLSFEEFINAAKDN